MKNISLHAALMALFLGLAMPGTGLGAEEPQSSDQPAIITAPSPSVVTSPTVTPSDAFSEKSAALHPAPAAPHWNANALSGGILGLAGDYSKAALVFGEFEKRPTRRLGLFARLAWVNFMYDNDFYRERGRGRGVELGARFYIKPEGNKQFYVGAGLGGWKLDWHWMDDLNTPFEKSGGRSSRTSSFEVHGGAKFYPGTGGLFMNPVVQLGSFFPNDEHDPLTFGRFYASLGLTIGASW